MLLLEMWKNIRYMFVSRVLKKSTATEIWEEFIPVKWTWSILGLTVRGSVDGCILFDFNAYAYEFRFAF